MVKKADQEAPFQAKCLKFLREEVGGWWTDIVVSTYQAQGDPDIVGCHEGLFYAFETKVKRYKTTRLQKSKLERIQRSGGVAMEIRSIDELKTVFKI